MIGEHHYHALKNQLAQITEAASYLEASADEMSVELLRV